MTPSAGPRLLGPADVRLLAAELDLRPTKQRGQNFVIDANTVRRIVRESGVGPDDVVVEVGPGLGSLTLALLEVARRVVAIEVDPLLAGRLPATVAELAPAQADRLEVVTADAMRVTEVPGPPPTALVANLPYNVSVPVLLHLLALLPSLERGLVMVQAEVADRLAAGPGSKVYGVPSVKAAWFADVRRAGSVGRTVFWPAPNVDSGLVAWTAARRRRHRCRGSGCSPSSTRRSPIAARRCAGRSASSPAPPRPRRRPWPPPASTRSRGASRCGSPTSSASPRPWISPVVEVRAQRASRPTAVTVTVPAKINLHLGVGAPREDGGVEPRTLKPEGAAALRRSRCEAARGRASRPREMRRAATTVVADRAAPHGVSRLRPWRPSHLNLRCRVAHTDQSGRQGAWAAPDACGWGAVP